MSVTFRVLFLLLLGTSQKLWAETPMPWPNGPKPQICSSNTYKQEFGNPNDIIHIKADVYQALCPQPLCKVSNGITTIGSDTRRLVLDNMKRFFFLLDGDTLMPAGNQAEAIVETTYTGNISITTDVTEAEILKLGPNCGTPTFEEGKLLLSFSANAIAGVTFAATGRASGRLGFASAGGETTDKRTLANERKRVPQIPPIEIDAKGKSLAELNAAINLASQAPIFALMEHLVEDLNDYFEKNLRVVWHEPVRTWWQFFESGGGYETTHPIPSECFENPQTCGFK